MQELEDQHEGQPEHSEDEPCCCSRQAAQEVGQAEEPNADEILPGTNPRPFPETASEPNDEASPWTPVEEDEADYSGVPGYYSPVQRSRSRSRSFPRPPTLLLMFFVTLCWHQEADAGRKHGKSMEHRPKDGSTPISSSAAKSKPVRLTETQVDPSNRLRDEKRGPAAWTNAQNDSSLESLTNRMLAHTVSDETGDARYIPAVAKWLNFINEHKLLCETWDERDRAVAAFEAYMCYIKDMGPSLGDTVMNGITYLWPESGGRMPRGWKCLKSWHRITVEGMGGPIGLESLACLEDQLRTWKEFVAADIIPVAADCYLREQDCEQLLYEDVIIDEVAQETVLLLGRSSRGESVKTGRNQGVRVDSDYAKEILARRLEEAKRRCKDPKKLSRERVFPISKAKYRLLWNKASTALGINPGPPHGARHTGASRDVAEGYRTMLQVQRRGRWTADRSVLRYARTHDWIVATSQQPTAIKEKGQKLLAGRQGRPAIAKE